MNPIQRTLERLEGYRVLLWQIFCKKLGTNFESLRVNLKPEGVSVVLIVDSDYVPSSSDKSECQVIVAQAAKIYRLDRAVRLEIQSSRESSAKKVYNTIIKTYLSKKEKGTREKILNSVRYNFLPKDCKGLLIRIKGKRGARRAKVTRVEGKVPRGTYLDRCFKETYVGQYGDSKGTSGIKIILVKSLPASLTPRFKSDRLIIPSKTLKSRL